MKAEKIKIIKCQTSGNIYEFSLDDELGKGQFGSVFLGRLKNGNSEKKFAIKIVEKTIKRGLLLFFSALFIFNL